MAGIYLTIYFSAAFIAADSVSGVQGLPLETFLDISPVSSRAMASDFGHVRHEDLRVCGSRGLVRTNSIYILLNQIKSQNHSWDRLIVSVRLR